MKRLAIWLLAILVTSCGLSGSGSRERKPESEQAPERHFSMPSLSVGPFKNQVVSDPTGVEAGVGWSSKTASPTFQNCVDGKERFVASPLGEAHSRRVESMESLYRDQTLSITARAKAQFGGGGGSVSASYRKFESTLANSNSLKLALSYTGEVGWSKLDPVDSQGKPLKMFHLTAEHRALLADHKPEAFTDACGDYFVLAVRRRSTATALVSVLFTNNEMRRKLETSLGVSANYGSASVSGTIAKIENFMKAESTTVSTVDVATAGFNLLTGEQAKYNSPDTLEEASGFFDSIALGTLNPVIYQVTLMPYQAVVDCNSLPCPKPQDAPTLDFAALYYERLNDLLREHQLVRLDAGNPLIKPADKAYMSQIHDLLTEERGQKLLADLKQARDTQEGVVKSAIEGTPCGEGGIPKCADILRDDIPYSLAIPVASSAVPQELKSSFQAAVTGTATSNGGTAAQQLEDVRWAYAYMLWWDRAERVIADRCGGESCPYSGYDYICPVLQLTKLAESPDDCSRLLGTEKPTEKLDVAAPERKLELRATRTKLAAFWETKAQTKAQEHEELLQKAIQSAPYR